MEIHLRPLESKDAPGMMEWMTDPTITCFFRFDSSKITMESCLSFIADALQTSSNKHFAIVDEEDAYLGTISLKNIDTEKRSAEYAISTRKCVHGTGAAMHATQKILELAFTELNLERVYLNVLAENKRANQFYKKAGFHFEYCEEDAVEIKNEWKTLNWYTISQIDYYEGQK